MAMNNSRILKSYQFSKTPTKYPKHFNIDLHIDDSIGVKMEGEMFGFQVLQIDTLIDEWVETILKAVNALPNIILFLVAPK